VKIAIFTDAYPPRVDGVATYTYRLAKWLKRKGHEPAIFTVDKKNSYEDSDGFEVYRMKGTVLKTYSQYIYRAIPPFRDVLPIIKEIEPDVIASHTPITMGAVAHLASRRFHIPLVAHYHTALIQFIELFLDSRDAPTPVLKTGVPRGLLKKAVNLISYPGFYYYFDDADAILSPSSFVTEDLVSHGIQEGKIKRIPNFIDPPERQMSGKEFREKWGLEDDFVVLHVGRLSWEKRIEKAIEAVRGMDVKLVVTSEGPHAGALKKFARKIGADNVIFTGYLPESELFGAYNACDAFITPSPYDTFNISAAQAVYAGKPVIGFRSGITDFVHHGVNGFVADNYEKEVADYRRWIEILKSDPDLKKEMGKNSKEVGKRFHISKVLPEVVDLYSNTPYTEYKRRRYVYFLSLILLFMKTARI